MKTADRIKSLTEDQLEMLDWCLGMFVNARFSEPWDFWHESPEYWGKPTIDEVLQTFDECEERSGMVIWSHKSLRIAISWLKRRGFVA